MDAFVQLALIEKAKQVFANDKTLMLSFPLLSPVSFTAAELAALAAPATGADYAAAADFARIVNFVPQDLVASASDRMLWDVYLDVLQRADVARGGGGRDSTAEIEILYEIAPDGARSDSAAMKRYREYRDAWLVARENYAQNKLSGELSEDPAVRQAWAETEEPALRGEVDAAAKAWEADGQRTLIEKALKAERDAAMQAPDLRWAEWSKAFNPDIDMITEANGTRYAPTGLSPRNFAEQEDWLDFDLTADEMRVLVDAAPPALKAVLDDDGGSDIESVSFQYRSVALVRSWFRPEALTSRIWRSTDPNLVLSDGTDSGQGACPAYVSACVFVRNIVEVKKASGGGGGSSQTFQNFDIGAIKPSRLVHRELRVDPSIFATVARRREIAPPPPQIVANNVRAFRVIQRNSFNLAAALPAATTEAPHTSGRRRWGKFGMRRHFPWTRPGGELAPADPEPAATPAPTPAPVREELSVLAFICKRLPATPDPAPGLSWV